MPDELMVSIEKLVYGGDGLAHADGNTIFVPYVLPGEAVRASTKSKKKKLIWANLLEVKNPVARTFRLAAVAITSTFPPPSSYA
jgi:tRNA/tmRNA/rRNA uracil-C5-methylase (TrmA/RlmC/RlmD family)